MGIERDELEESWQNYLRTATTSTGERLNAYHQHFSQVQDAFTAGVDVAATRVDELEAEIARLRQELDEARAQIPVAVVTAVDGSGFDAAAAAEVITLTSDRDRELASAVLRAAANEAREIERIGSTAYVAMQPGEAQRFDHSELASFYRTGDKDAHILWLDTAARRASQGVLPAGASIAELEAGLDLDD